MSASELMAFRSREKEELRQVYPSGVSLFDPECPPEARVWISQSGIRPELAASRYGIEWGDKLFRVIIPTRSRAGGRSWIGRSVRKGQLPKYIVPPGSDGFLWWRQEPDRPYVVTEDILSAIKCHEAGYSALALMGTSVPDAARLILADHKVYGWLDNDKAGEQGFMRLRKALAVQGITPVRVQGTKDPKYYTKGEIVDKIEEADGS